MTEMMEFDSAFQTQLTFYFDERYWGEKLNKIWGMLSSYDDLNIDL